MLVKTLRYYYFSSASKPFVIINFRKAPMASTGQILMLKDKSK